MSFKDAFNIDEILEDLKRYKINESKFLKLAGHKKIDDFYYKEAKKIMYQSLSRNENKAIQDFTTIQNIKSSLFQQFIKNFYLLERDRSLMNVVQINEKLNLVQEKLNSFTDSAESNKSEFDALIKKVKEAVKVIDAEIKKCSKIVKDASETAKSF
jgi:hypothetical protein